MEEKETHNDNLTLETMTHYTDFNYRHNTYEAIGLPFEEVEEILGHEHNGMPEDDEKLVEYLVGHTEYSYDSFGEGTIGEDEWVIFIEPGK